jgi:hypothetical protein
MKTLGYAILFIVSYYISLVLLECLGLIVPTDDFVVLTALAPWFVFYASIPLLVIAALRAGYKWYKKREG